MSENDSHPLVSIIVITYNSDKYVLETLKSAKSQTYHNIELIISDDCSTDTTVSLCKTWLLNNSQRFVNTVLITHPENTGISPNCNRGLAHAKGIWVKFIAGDDTLMDSCIEKNLDFVEESHHSFFFSQMTFTIENNHLASHFRKGFELMTKGKCQLEVLLRANFLSAPSAFIRYKALIELGGFDERFPMLDDYPLWIKAAKNNYLLIFNKEPTVVYRIHDKAISQNQDLMTGKGFYESLPLRKSKYYFMQEVLIKEQLKNYMFLNVWDTLIQLLQFRLMLNIPRNMRNIFSRAVYIILQLFRPYFYIRLFNKINN